jgi:hypothetical protein
LLFIGHLAILPCTSRDTGSDPRAPAEAAARFYPEQHPDRTGVLGNVRCRRGDLRSFLHVRALLARVWFDNQRHLVFSRPARDIIAGMTWGEVELEPEVRDWLEGLDDQRWAQAMFHLDLLEEPGRGSHCR